MNKLLVPTDIIKSKIFFIRNKKVMLDNDLARLYGVSTKALNQAVKRNRKRFPPDFMFRLTRAEKKEVVTICDHLYSLKFSPQLPLVFTEHGALMLSSVLNSDKAAEVGIFIVRAFIKMREMLSAHKGLLKKIDEMEKKYDMQFKVVFDAIRKLMEPPAKKVEKIGFLR